MNAVRRTEPRPAGRAPGRLLATALLLLVALLAAPAARAQDERPASGTDETAAEFPEPSAPEPAPFPLLGPLPPAPPDWPIPGTTIAYPDAVLGDPFLDEFFSPTLLPPTMILVPGMPFTMPPRTGGLFVGLDDVEVSCAAPDGVPGPLVATIDLHVHANTTVRAIVTLAARGADDTGRPLGTWTVPVHRSENRILRIVGPAHWQDEMDAGTTDPVVQSPGSFVRAWSCTLESEDGGTGGGALACRFALGTILLEEIQPKLPRRIRLPKRHRHRRR